MVLYMASLGSKVIAMLVAPEERGRSAARCQADAVAFNRHGQLGQQVAQCVHVIGLGGALHTTGHTGQHAEAKGVRFRGNAVGRITHHRAAPVFEALLGIVHGGIKPRHKLRDCLIRFTRGCGLHRSLRRKYGWLWLRGSLLRRGRTIALCPRGLCRCCFTGVTALRRMLGVVMPVMA